MYSQPGNLPAALILGGASMRRVEVEQIGISIQCEKCKSMLLYPLAYSMERFSPQGEEDRAFPKFLMLVQPHDCTKPQCVMNDIPPPEVIQLRNQE